MDISVLFLKRNVLLISALTVLLLPTFVTMSRTSNFDITDYVAAALTDHDPWLFIWLVKSTLCIPLCPLLCGTVLRRCSLPISSDSLARTDFSIQLFISSVPRNSLDSLSHIQLTYREDIPRSCGHQFRGRATVAEHRRPYRSHRSTACKVTTNV